eukprot:CAMPEP_0179926378 /NCGR_PEP_ID=MMETSP0983-20121128/7752_1 /TAXON_ID=483367 /ORGANISM="non described non described, Strain CCMP 2436" /LENGTH=376 /DNA_ID=CAMNT_0021830011 /DNA_START=125 /DNA_END=1256 /DNA_ORIENTATION=+
MNVIITNHFLKKIDAPAALEEGAAAHHRAGTLCLIARAGLGAAELEFEEAVEQLLAGLTPDLRQAFVWRATGRLGAFEADALQPAAVAPRENAAEESLEAIRQALRKRVGPKAVDPDETFYFPAHLPEFEGYTAESVEHVDAFLYDEAELDDLVEEGKLSRYYAGPAGPRDMKELNFVSHSFSVAQLRFIFSDAVAGPLAGKTLVDVGARLGAVLWGGALFSQAERLVGVELSGYFAKVQQEVIDKFKLHKRVEAMHADVLTCEPLLREADVLVLNNVFEFFHSRQQQQQIWTQMRQLLSKKGQRLITVPALCVSLARAGSELDLSQWVREVPVAQPYPSQPSLEEASVAQSAFHSEALAEQNEAFACIHVYEVLG